MPNKLALIKSRAPRKADRPLRVECLLDGLDIGYQLKIWFKSANRIWLLVKKNSTLLPLLNPGDTLHLRCYYTESRSPSEYLKTTVMSLNNKDKGLLRGHHIVSSEILESRIPDQGQETQSPLMIRALADRTPISP